jgi:hypothetical protein
MNIRLHSIACAAALAFVSACDLGKIDERAEAATAASTSPARCHESAS